MRIRFWLAAAAVSFIVPQTASAEEAVERAIRGWISALDATPEWAASIGALTYDPASDTALVTDLVIRPEQADAVANRLGFSLGTLAVTGYAEGPDRYTIRSITADDGFVEAGFTTIRLADIAFSDFSAPFGLSFSHDERKPFSSMMKSYAEIVGIGLESARIGTVTLDQTHEGVTTRIVYRDFAIDDMADGRIARFDTGAVSMDAPTPDGLVRMTMSGIESRDTDLGAFIHVYDPDAYVGGVGDMVWRNALAYAAYNDVVVQVPGVRVNIGNVVVEDFKLRQPPESFVGFFDDMIARPDMPDALAERLAMRAIPAMFSSFSVGRFAILDTSVEAMGIDHLVVRDFHMNDFSIDGLGEFGVEGIASVVQGQGAIELDRFAFGGITFGGYDALRQIIDASMASPAPDLSDLSPRLGFMELVGLELQTPDIPRLSLERFRTDLANYIGFIPTRASAALTGLSIPVTAITDRSTRDMFRRLGYDRIVSAFGFDAEYDRASERLTLSDLHYAISDMGSFAMNGTVAGLPVVALGNEAVFQRIMPGLLLKRASFTFKDDSIVGKGLDLLAGFMNAPVGMFRDQFADAMPFLLSLAVQNDPKLMAIINQSGLFKQLTPVVRDFIANPGSSITVSLAPPTPVRIEAIGFAVENTPNRVVEMLGLTISGEKGSLPPPAPEPEPVPSDPGGTTPSVEPGGGSTGGGASTGGGMTPATPAQPGGTTGGGSDTGAGGAGGTDQGGSTPASRTGTE
jgi:hypothetical protein